MQSLKPGWIYFLLVFSAGFALGIVRTLWVVPWTGVRIAELMEAPIMLAVSVLAARWVIRRFAVPYQPSRRLAMGCAALGLMLLAELSLALWLRRIPLREYLATRDPVSGTVYYILLVVFALMPMLVGRREKV